MAGKGDSYRKVDQKKWSDNYDRIFGKKNVEKEKDQKPETGKRSKNPKAS